MRYEGLFKEIEKTPEMFNNLMLEYDNIKISLDRMATDEEKSILYADLIKLIVRISNYMLENEEILRKGIGNIMGGHVLELESERLIREATEKGMKAGIDFAIKKYVASLMKLSIDNNKIIEEIVNNFDVTKEKAIKYVEEFRDENNI